MNQSTKEWIKLVCIIFATGSGITVASYTSGAKLWVAILCGLGAGASNVITALQDPPRKNGNGSGGGSASNSSGNPS